MSITNDEAYQLTKAQLSDHEKLMKSQACRDYLKKRQQKRGGVGQGFYKLQARTADGEAPGTVTKADGYIRTVYDMVDYYYGFLPEYMSEKSEGMAKQDNSVVSTDDGYRNAVYGSEVFSLINSEPNIFALLENRAWTKSGVRIVQQRGHADRSGGIGENANVPDTDHPPIDEFEIDPETIAHSFDVSQEKQLLSQTDDDDLDDPFDWLRRWYGVGTEHQTGMGEHPKHMNEQLGTKVDDIADGTVDDSDDLLSIDKLISNAAESNILSDPTANDVYGFDRSSNEFESNVIENGGSTVTFTADVLDDMIRLVKSNSGRNPVTDDNYFFLTNHDTYQRIENELGGKERLEAERVTVGLNGVQTQPGGDYGITVQSYKNIPIFESIDVPQDDLGRVYLIDSTTLYMKTLLPTQFYSTGTEVNANPFARDKMGNEGLYTTIAQTTLSNPAAHAKARDLS